MFKIQSLPFRCECINTTSPRSATSWSGLSCFDCEETSPPASLTYSAPTHHLFQDQSSHYVDPWELSANMTHYLTKKGRWNLPEDLKKEEERTLALLKADELDEPLVLVSTTDKADLLEKVFLIDSSKSLLVAPLSSLLISLMISAGLLSQPVSQEPFNGLCSRYHYFLLLSAFQAELPPCLSPG